ncbi:hypothetical protein AJ80_08702 [Polytolypa hystricis UAMH7299]|uniref:Cytochrome P450 monooxygenase n=1 Tax=Polytolypa hystricis (strain UAMH7299) TaxID=1447883 RepID=A0A2B7X3L5_POLH7|nr:hypothetical protein AJ80_08702 [Polytolypa hystricis UAMH7299]
MALSDILSYAWHQLPVRTLLLAYGALIIGRSVYRIWFHPLARFPGPLLAKVTWYWEGYKELVERVSMAHELVELHKKYGEIMRIGPNQLHFARPSAYHEIYNQSIRWDKAAMQYHNFGINNALVCNLTYRNSKERKDILQPLFSRRAIISMQWLIQENADKLCRRLAENNKNGKSSDIFLAARCFTLDTVFPFCYGRPLDTLDAEDFRAPIVEAMEGSMELSTGMKHFSLIRDTLQKIAPWLPHSSDVVLSGFVQLQNLLHKQVSDVIKHPERLNDAPYPTIYHALLQAPKDKPHLAPTWDSLYHEAMSLIFAGVDTTSNSLMLAIFNLVDRPDYVKRLQEELWTAWPDLSSPPPKLEVLEKLPFLTGVAKEALRMSIGVPCPLYRVVPPSGATISGQFIPGGTIVGMSQLIPQMSETIFEDPSTFNPDRWLQQDSSRLEPYLVAFSKGPRSCLGTK